MTPAGVVDGVLAGRYRMQARIATGGMGEVWRAEDELGRVVAVKLLKPEYVDDPEFRERFRSEARHAAGLSHPGIAAVFDYGEQVDPEPAAWLVMELVEGEPLSTLLHREGALEPTRALDVVGQAALALEAAHAAGVVHRDVKPGNLLVRPDGVVKVTDFGIARAVDAVPVTRTGTLVGTAYYLSPEQAAGDPVTPASDVYSLGVVAYECLAGRRPFPGTSDVAIATAHLREEPPALPATVPAAVIALVAEAMRKDPRQRPVHAGEFGRTAMALRETLLAERAEDLADASPSTVLLPLPVDPPAPLRPAGATSVTRSMPPRPGPTRGHSRAAARRSVRLVLVLLAVVVLGVSLRSCLAPQGDQPGGSVRTGAPSPRASTSSQGVVVVSSAYAGKTYAAVRDALVRLGLRPSAAYDGTGQPAGTVASVTPTGTLARGSAVLVHVVPAAKATTAPAPAPAPAGKRKHGKK